MTFMGLFKLATKDRQQVSVILKRQIPIRFHERSHSWLGGLPMIPKTVEWPRDPKGAPLHFVAQISCANLPPGLWNGQGPREGWLLFFVESVKLEDEARSDLIRILHIDVLGPEREPPEDMPTVRHTMSDYIDYTKPNIRPGVPKLWRKWPVDFVTQTYDVDEGDEDFAPPPVSAEALYGAAVSENGLTGGDTFGIEQPLTWRGALYFLEGVVRDLNPGAFKSRFLGYGLLGAPEADQGEFVDELQKRVAADPACTERAPGWGPRVKAATDQVKADLKEQRSTGWMKRAYVALDKERAGYEKWLDTYQTELREKGANLDAAGLQRLEANIAFHLKSIETCDEARAYLDELFASYPGPEGEQRFNAEIKAVGEAHLAWGEEMAERADRCLQKVHSQNLDEPISSADWDAIREQFIQAKSVYWQQAGPRCLAKSERGLALDRHVTMAIHEDLLDLYTRDATSLQSHILFQRDAFEEQLRYIEAALPHRIGGHRNPVQGEGMRGCELVLQLASDRPMGWFWGDAGAMYVMMTPKDLKKGHYTNLFAIAEGH